MASSTRTRMTATERSEEVLRAAVTAFAESGYAATKTDEIARLAGVSQPYVIRLFGTKQQLFLAVTHRVYDRVEEVFRAAAAEGIEPDSTGEEKLRALGKGYQTFLSEHELLRVLLQSFAAASDPAIGLDVRARFGGIYGVVQELTGASVQEMCSFLGTGMLLTVMAAMGVAGPDSVDVCWATDMLESLRAEGD
ncbi:TetR/AcrR family transcriptional regulator [Nocardia pseudovaccinii]|uniref:TetR/AcrR family transcriptional regulator n=1 Tax=Nocardia pseudovaccinii TaxID=189540 RepID=UPI0007A43AFA|nr:TetR/AcrR family transcriptional regulator [Nocardia pseudovaccinii]